MSKLDEIEFIRHIYVEVRFILDSMSKVSEDEFYEDEILKRAITRAFEIIGEATKNLSLDFRLKYNNVPWSYMAKLRDRIIHHYQGVDFEMIWNITRENIPELDLQITKIINEHSYK
ncbi:Uncharacterized conserved protein, contains HEPN domain [Flavobacterium micromati]|uniref:Uncharacterized conserved protein, contains HEPN domain n=1 Tax=Flavobacterium micromati TaxID=229205 RepID=A0A1M5LPF4_9FLAO|nr:HepT-like ribonuclease domain-containing protein [Flavobacterium micromati]SHG66984.1 Uncharacterized conserved protein, contains HEPN domain [Flavobacterium micromati]